jgi:hypothetical protein
MIRILLKRISVSDWNREEKRIVTAMLAMSIINLFIVLLTT